MRVTNKMLSNSFLTDMRSNLENMQTLQQQMTSGKEIRKPSDDPARVARAMQLHTDINANNQYKTNINDTINWLDTTDAALGQAGNVLQKVRELLVSAGNAAYGSSERTSIKDEINQRIDQFAQIMNTNFDGSYIFGGSRASDKPMSTKKAGNNTELQYDNAADSLGNPNPTEIAKLDKKLFVEISQGVTMDYNVTSGEIVQFRPENTTDDKADNLIDLFKNIVNHLDNAADTSKLSNGDLSDVTDAINNLLKVRSQVGAKQNRMDSAKDKNEDETANLTSILSRTEDIDITEKTMQYATLQTVYMASLQTSAKVLQPTLLDYLR
ncbi:flagellar hook-associated protein FlgL [Clostridium sp. YIM B02515]|uniref:Flagellar hook-associated protein FlgL n=1 Tax=Clostridium rhizosphaerae TaxID=2803861 RepID=A0ABS1TF62_9CLOT|nr:flagellar hook-associated protein FlgL [Clostridium rhizosphaerae]MBL4938011.1 flagellar hook-associated protein FlgL [Clostridium rhizosphaerae]